MLSRSHSTVLSHNGVAVRRAMSARLPTRGDRNLKTTQPPPFVATSFMVGRSQIGCRLPSCRPLLWPSATGSIACGGTDLA